MDRDRLFVTTVDWLDQIGHRLPPSEHELLLASGRLRMLLLDSTRLVDQVNRERQLKVRYRILRHGDGPPLKHMIKLWVVPDGLSPELVPPNHNVPIEDVKLDQFLGERVLIFDGLNVSVRDLINYVSNVVGGVHSGTPRTPEQERLQALAEEIVLMGMDVPIRCLRGIVVVAVAALRPLREAIVDGVLDP